MPTSVPYHTRDNADRSHEVYQINTHATGSTIGIVLHDQCSQYHYQ